MKNSRLVLFLGCLLSELLFSSLDLYAASIEIDWPDNAPTHAVYRRELLQFNLNELQLYEAHTRDEPKSRDAAREFLKVAIYCQSEQYYDQEPIVRREDELPMLCEQAVQAGSSDPLVLLHRVEVLLSLGDPAQASKVAALALKKLDDSDYPRGLRLLFLMRALNAELRSMSSSGIDETRKGLYENVPAWFQYCSQTPPGQQMVWQRIALSWYDFIPSRVLVISEQELKGVEACEAHKAIDPWLMKMVRGRYHRNLAWARRGGGYSGTVTPEGWKSFEEEIAIARESYLAAHEIHPEFPEAAVAMMEIAMIGAHSDSIQDWFKRAIDAEVDHRPALVAMMWSLRPRWGGTLDEMLSFAMQCGRSNRYDTQIFEMMFEGLCDVHSEDIPWKELFDRPGLYDEVIEISESVYQDPSRKTDLPLGRLESSMRSWHLAFAIQTDRFEEAKRQWDKLGDKVREPLLARAGLKGSIHRSRTFAMAEFSDQLPEIEARARSYRSSGAAWQEVLDAYKQLLAKSQDAESKDYFDSWIDQARTGMEYFDGEWVDIQFDKHMSHWKGNTKHCEYENKNSIVISSEKQNLPAEITYLTRLPGPKEIEVELEVIHGTTKRVRPGIVFGDASPGNGGRFFTIDVRSKRADIQGSSTKCHWFKLDSEPSKLGARNWGPQMWEIVVDGNAFTDGLDPYFKPRSDEFGIGFTPTQWTSATVRFKNLRIRKLMGLPPEAVTKPQEEPAK